MHFTYQEAFDVTSSKIWCKSCLFYVTKLANIFIKNSNNLHKQTIPWKSFSFAVLLLIRFSVGYCVNITLWIRAFHPKSHLFTTILLSEARNLDTVQPPLSFFWHKNSIFTGYSQSVQLIYFLTLKLYRDSLCNKQK